MTPSMMVKLFFRRMVWLKLANLCPFVAGRVAIYRLMGAQIGRDVFIGFHIELDTNFTELIEIGNHVTISHRCTIATHMGTPVTTPVSQVFPNSCAPVKIQDGAWICIGATILPGVTIGRNAVVAAGSVVSKDVGENMLVGGVPAKPIRQLKV